MQQIHTLFGPAMKKKLRSNFAWLSMTIKIYLCWCDLIEAENSNFLSINPVKTERTTFSMLSIPKCYFHTGSRGPHGPDRPSGENSNFQFQSNLLSLLFLSLKFLQIPLTWGPSLAKQVSEKYSIKVNTHSEGTGFLH